MDRYRIDGHKLHYHVARVHEWLEGKSTYPIYAEISPAGSCNHRCVYCALDFMGYKPRFLDARVLKRRLSELAARGLKSVMYAGEGEPFLHKEIAGIISHTRRTGLDVAATTNGVLYTPGLADATLKHMSWIKASVNAGTPRTYARIHRAPQRDFARVLDNMAYAAALRARRGWRCALGIQMVLLPENRGEAVTLARKAKEIGMDYLVVKPYSQHPRSITTKYRGVKYSGYERLAKRLQALGDAGFQVIFRSNAMRRWDRARKSYRRCLALPFWTYIDAGGDVWGCGVFLGRKDFHYGNINRRTFAGIWEGGPRRASLKKVSRMDVSRCRINCRMDEINKYLWRLRTPPEHVNFI